MCSCIDIRDLDDRGEPRPVPLTVTGSAGTAATQITQDYAAGTSSKSSELIHGGLRYLEREHGEIGLVFESVSERAMPIGQANAEATTPKYHFPQIRDHLVAPSRRGTKRER